MTQDDGHEVNPNPLSTAGAGTAAKARPIVYTAVGDMAFVNQVADALARGDDPIAPVGHLIQGDLRVANLETALVTHAAINPARGGLRSDVEAVAICARWFNVVNLANNHTMDCGQAGLAETIAALDAHGLAHFGAGMDAEAARRPVVVERDGLRIGQIGFSQNELDAADDGQPGVNPLRPSAVLAQVRQLASQVDVAIVHLHEGYEFYEQPRPAFVAMCRAVVEAGAALVCGHHPHVPQGIERWTAPAGRQGAILYSLGNFLFDYPYHRTYRWTRLCPIVTCDLTHQGVESLNVAWAMLTDRGVLQPAGEAECAQAQAHLDRLSATLDEPAQRDAVAAQAVNEVIRTIFQGVFELGRQQDAAGLEHLLRQTRRDPYLKAFTDYARLHGQASLLTPESVQAYASTDAPAS